MELKDKSVLLTGATGGIGRCVAQTLARQGARLILLGRKEAELARLAAQLPGQHRTLTVDLQAPDALRETGRRWGLEAGVDVLINLAGSNDFAYLAQRDAASVAAEIALDLTVPILLCQQALQWRQPPALILNVGSTFGAIGYPGYSSYCAAKAGLYRFSEALDRELAGSGTRVLYLGPRATETGLNSASVQALNRQLGNRVDRPQVVAEALLKSLQRERSVRWLGWPEKLFVTLNQLLPSVVAKAIHKQQAVIRRYAQQARTGVNL